MRLPRNIQQLESLSDLSPTAVLGKQKPQLHQLSFLPLFQGDVGILDQQWSRISSLEWAVVGDSDVEQFWVNVAAHKDMSGSRDFQELAGFALSLLALPFSNASVERVFSQMNLIKTKLRNRMQQGLLEAILHV